jgi:hypothetical protein
MSKRFLMERYLGLTEEEIKKNEELWREERGTAEASAPTGQDLRSVGISPAGLETDITTGEEIGAMEPAGALDAAATGVPGAAPGTAPAAPGAATPPAA